MRLGVRERRAVAIGGVLAGLIVAYAGLAPLYDRWVRAGEQMAAAQKKLGRVEEAQKLARRADELRETAGRAVTSYAWRGRLTEHVPRTIAQIEDFATYSQLSVTRLEPLPIEDHERYAKVSLALSFDCALPALSQFLYDLERAQPVLAVETMQVSASRLGLGRLEVNMRVSSLAMVEEAGAG